MRMWCKRKKADKQKYINSCECKLTCEAFAAEYGNSYLNENSETAKLMKVIKIKDKQLTEAKKAVEENNTLRSELDSLKATVEELVGSKSQGLLTFHRYFCH